MSPVSSPTPILLVADSSDTCERIASALLSAPDFYRIERVSSAELMASNPPADLHIALVDAALLASTQADVVQRLNAAGMAVVAMVNSQDVQALQAVVLAGAASLLAMPFDNEELWKTVTAAQERGSRSVPAGASRDDRQAGRTTEGIVVAIYGPKGGSGTSVLAANLAVNLQERAPRGVALVEIGEGPGSIGVLLNLRAERTIADLLARFAPADTELLNGVLTPHASGIRVLLAPQAPGLIVGADIVEDVISSLKTMFDFVLVDLSSAGRAGAVSVMRRAHAALVVVVPEMTSLHHSRLFIEHVAVNAPDVHLNIVLNRSNMPGGVPAEAIRRHLKMPTAVEIPDEPNLMVASVNRGVPVVTGQPRSAVAKALQKLAHDLVPADAGRAEASTSAQNAPAAGLFGLLAWGSRRG
ncbi:MAG TPA: hypothetical protein VGA61_06930 [Anaerolineae bacterium]